MVLLQSFGNATPELEASFAPSLAAVREKAVRVAGQHSLQRLDAFARGVPLVLSFLYLAHGFTVNSGDEAEEDVCSRMEANFHSMAAINIRDYMHSLTGRWGLATAYVKILEAKRVVQLT